MFYYNKIIQKLVRFKEVNMKKIVNVKRFIISNTILFLLIGICIATVTNNTYSYTSPKYKTIYVQEGDTLWNIASNERDCNLYYQNEDVRNIIIDIKNINKLDISNLKVGQELRIPIN